MGRPFRGQSGALDEQSFCQYHVIAQVLIYAVATAIITPVGQTINHQRITLLGLNAAVG